MVDSTPGKQSDTTTTTTTAIVVPQPSSPQPKMYDSLGAIAFVAGIIIVALTMVGSILGIVKNVSDFFERRKLGDKEKAAPLEGRIRSLEDSSRTFRSSEYLDKEFNRLEQKVDHEKGNRQGVSDTLANQIRTLESKFGDEQQVRARLETKVEGVVSNAQRVESSVNLLRERMDERFDRLQEYMATKTGHGPS